MTKAFPTSTLNSEPDRDDEVVKRFQRVHYWHEADVTWARRRVRFQGESGHDADWMSLPRLTPNGHGGLLDHSSAATIKLEGIEKPRNPLYLSLTH
jgi:hypothetical protein